MKALLLRLEPIIWLLFGAGIMVGTLLLPGYLLTVGLGAPLGLLPEGALSYERAHMLGSNPIGRLVLMRSGLEAVLPPADRHLVGAPGAAGDDGGALGHGGH